MQGIEHSWNTISQDQRSAEHQLNITALQDDAAIRMPISTTAMVTSVATSSSSAMSTTTSAAWTALVILSLIKVVHLLKLWLVRVTLTGRHSTISAALVAVLAVVSGFVVVVVRTVTESNQIAKHGLEGHAKNQDRKLCMKLFPFTKCLHLLHAYCAGLCCCPIWNWAVVRMPDTFPVYRCPWSRPSSCPTAPKLFPDSSSPSWPSSLVPCNNQLRFNPTGYATKP